MIQTSAKVGTKMKQQISKMLGAKSEQTQCLQRFELDAVWN
jgi:hypothetical protein